MRKLLLLLTLALALATNAAVLPIGANGDWTTDLWLRNPSSSTITQKIGHLTFTKPGFDPIVLESSVTLKPNETRRIKRVDQLYDQGLWILSVDPKLESSAFLTYRGIIARFEVEGVNSAIFLPGDHEDFYRVAIDAGTGTFPVLMNQGTQAQVELKLIGPDGSSVLSDSFVQAPPGVSLWSIPAQAPDGATLRICHTACGVGVPAPGSTIFAFVVTGPPDGGTQAVRYGK